MPDAEDPPPKTYALKPRQFERVNAPRGTDAPSDDHDVFKIRQQVRAREAADGLDEVKLVAPPRSRRRRDYLLLLAAGNLFMLTTFCIEIYVGFSVQSLAAGMPEQFPRLVYYAWHEGRPMFFLPAVCMSAYSGALTWLIFGVMAKY